MTVYYRKDSARGVTAPDPEVPKDIVQHITKHRGMKSPYTSVSDNSRLISHFCGILYSTESDAIAEDNHSLINHDAIVNELRNRRQSATRQ